MHYAHVLTLTLALPILAETSISQFGCYSHVPGLTKSTTYPFQSLTYCETKCQRDGFRVAALSQGSTCACSHQVPKESEKVDDDRCDSMCDGWPEDKCGGANAHTVLSTGDYTALPNTNSNSNLNSNLNSNPNSNSKFDHESNSKDSDNEDEDEDEPDHDDSSRPSPVPGGIIVAPTNINPSSVPTRILTAPASMMAKASSAASRSASATFTSTVTSTMASPTLNAAESLPYPAGYSMGVLVGLGMLL